jgi:acyl-coenzyme A synthetase/AMP-(fatty) acid ligase
VVVGDLQMFAGCRPCFALPSCQKVTRALHLIRAVLSWHRGCCASLAGFVGTLVCSVSLLLLGACCSSCPSHRRVVEKFRVNSLFTAPTALRAIRGVDSEAVGLQDHDISSLRSIWLAGERTDPATLQWSRKLFSSLPVIDHYWQSETGT